MGEKSGGVMIHTVITLQIGVDLFEKNYTHIYTIEIDILDLFRLAPPPLFFNALTSTLLCKNSTQAWVAQKTYAH